MPLVPPMATPVRLTEHCICISRIPSNPPAALEFVNVSSFSYSTYGRWRNRLDINLSRGALFASESRLEQTIALAS